MVLLEKKGYEVIGQEFQVIGWPVTENKVRLMKVLGIQTKVSQYINLWKEFIDTRCMKQYWEAQMLVKSREKERDTGKLIWCGEQGRPTWKVV